MIEFSLCFLLGVVVGIFAAAVYLHAHTTAAVAAVTKIYAETEGIFGKKPAPPVVTVTSSTPPPTPKK